MNSLLAAAVLGIPFLAQSPWDDTWDSAVIEAKRVEQANINYRRYGMIQQTPPFDGVSFSTRCIRFANWEKMRNALRDLEECHDVPYNVIMNTWAKLKTITEGFDGNQLILDYDTISISTEIDYSDMTLKIYVENVGK